MTILQRVPPLVSAHNPFGIFVTRMDPSVSRAHRLLAWYRRLHLHTYESSSSYLCLPVRERDIIWFGLTTIHPLEAKPSVQILSLSYAKFKLKAWNLLDVPALLVPTCSVVGIGCPSSSFPMWCMCTPKLRSKVESLECIWGCAFHFMKYLRENKIGCSKHSTN